MEFFITTLKQVCNEYSEVKPSYNQTQHQIILLKLKKKKKKKSKKIKKNNIYGVFKKKQGNLSPNLVLQKKES